MTNNLSKAKELLKQGSFTCVLCREDITYTSSKRGVAPLVDWIDSKTDLRGFSAADKIVGKAAALLFVHSGVQAVYAPVMSQTATEVFSKHHITFHTDKIVPVIINRQGTGPCPMEQAVAGIDKPEPALQAIRQKMLQLKTKQI